VFEKYSNNLFFFPLGNEQRRLYEAKTTILTIIYILKQFLFFQMVNMTKETTTRVSDFFHHNHSQSFTITSNTCAGARYMSSRSSHTTTLADWTGMKHIHHTRYVHVIYSPMNSTRQGERKAETKETRKEENSNHTSRSINNNSIFIIHINSINNHKRRRKPRDAPRYDPCQADAHQSTRTAEPA